MSGLESGFAGWCVVTACSGSAGPSPARHRGRAAPGAAAVPQKLPGTILRCCEGSAMQSVQGHHRRRSLCQGVLNKNPPVAVALQTVFIYNFHSLSSVAKEKLNFPSGAEAWLMSHCASLANLRSAVNYSVTADTKWAEKMLILSG